MMTGVLFLDNLQNLVYIFWFCEETSAMISDRELGLKLRLFRTVRRSFVVRSIMITMITNVDYLKIVWTQFFLLEGGMYRGHAQ